MSFSLPASPGTSREPTRPNDIDTLAMTTTRQASSVCALLTCVAVLATILSACDEGPTQPATAAAFCEVIPPTPCPDPPLRYTNTIEPIIKTRCVPCHDGRGPQWPLTTYGSVTDWYDQVQLMVADCTMPPPDGGVQLPTAERGQILTWIRCGYPN